jgi:uncharacterized protein YndB with AHSA1/START domain
MTSSTIPPVRHTVTVSAGAKHAFDIFAGAMASWFPHHIGEEEVSDIVVEPQVGGRWFERGTGGTECDWGRVLAYDPPHRIVLAWHLNGEWRFEPDPARASEIEITFTEEGPERTRVEFDHHNFERHGETGARQRDAVAAANGWGDILATYAKTASRPPDRE